jgi:branched-subunit amino acid ABC-type transport system permease component
MVDSLAVMNAVAAGVMAAVVRGGMGRLRGRLFASNILGITESQSAKLTGRKAGFELYPISDCFSA